MPEENYFKQHVKYSKNMIFWFFFEIEFLQVVENIYEYSCYVSYIECRYFSLKHHENKSFFFLMLKHFIYFFSENMATRLFRLLVRERRLAARILVVGSKRFLATVRVCLPCIVYGQECLIRYILRKNCLCINSEFSSDKINQNGEMALVLFLKSNIHHLINTLSNLVNISAKNAFFNKFWIFFQ